MLIYKNEEALVSRQLVTPPYHRHSGHKRRQICLLPGKPRGWQGPWGTWAAPLAGLVVWGLYWGVPPCLQVDGDHAKNEAKAAKHNPYLYTARCWIHAGAMAVARGRGAGLTISSMIEPDMLQHVINEVKENTQNFKVPYMHDWQVFPFPPFPMCSQLCWWVKGKSCLGQTSAHAGPNIIGRCAGKPKSRGVRRSWQTIVICHPQLLFPRDWNSVEFLGHGRGVFLVWGLLSQAVRCHIGHARDVWSLQVLYPRHLALYGYLGSQEVQGSRRVWQPLRDR